MFPPFCRFVNQAVFYGSGQETANPAKLTKLRRAAPVLVYRILRLAREWVPLNIEGLKLKAIYDLQPQYKDTLVRNDGSVIDVPIWVKYPDWKKDK